jgi:hypothetical protein
MSSAPVKMKLKKEVLKKDRAWFVTFDTGKEDWFPCSTITAYNPGQLTIHIQSWILTQKQIPFKF